MYVCVCVCVCVSTDIYVCVCVCVCVCTTEQTDASVVLAWCVGIWLAHVRVHLREHVREPIGRSVQLEKSLLQHLLRCQYLYFCTSKASKLST